MFNLKKHSRILAICGGKVTFTEGEKTPIVAVLWRNPYIDKFYIEYTQIDSPPSNITSLLTEFIDINLFSDHHIKFVIFFNTILAGLSLIDINKLYISWKVPLIFISEKKPENEKILEIAKTKNYFNEFSSVLRSNPNNWFEFPNTNLFVLPVGIEKIECIHIIQKTQLIGNIPEPLRISKLVATSLPII